MVMVPFGDAVCEDTQAPSSDCWCRNAASGITNASLRRFLALVGIEGRHAMMRNIVGTRAEALVAEQTHNCFPILSAV